MDNIHHMKGSSLSYYEKESSHSYFQNRNSTFLSNDQQHLITEDISLSVLSLLFITLCQIILAFMFRF